MSKLSSAPHLVKNDEVNVRVEMIQSLIPIALEAVADLLSHELDELAGPSRRDHLKTWISLGSFSMESPSVKRRWSSLWESPLMGRKFLWASLRPPPRTRSCVVILSRIWWIEGSNTNKVSWLSSMDPRAYSMPSLAPSRGMSAFSDANGTNAVT